MESKNGGESPKFTFCDDDGRAKIDRYEAKSKFRPGDQVYFYIPGTQIREGPYTVASVPGAQRYSLCLANGDSVKDGNEVEEKDLEEVDPGQSRR